ncbi:MAG: phosphoadenosine phosphosulfate reductase domain-containing protein, partial [Planctomycetota bacterium]
MDQLDQLEAKGIQILRESYREFSNLCMLWSIGKDSTVLLWLARKAFFGHVPFPLVHVDTNYKVPSMITYRDDIAREWNLNMVVGQNKAALEAKQTFPDGNVDRLTCCKHLKSEALKHTLSGDWP